MKYSLINCVNGNYSVVSEHSTKQSGIIAFHQTCAALWNAPDVIKAVLNLVDENLHVVDGRYTETITHEAEEAESEE